MRFFHLIDPNKLNHTVGQEFLMHDAAPVRKLRHNLKFCSDMHCDIIMLGINIEGNKTTNVNFYKMNRRIFINALN